MPAVRNALIVGGGIAGLGAAIALGQRGIDTTLVEQREQATGAAIGFQYRPLQALQELGLLEQVITAGDTMYASEDLTSTPVWNGDGVRQAVPFAELDEDWPLPLAVTIYRPVLSEIMQRAARQHGTEVLIGETYESVSETDDGVEVELSTGERRRFDLLLAADGLNSGLRERFFPEAPKPEYTGSMSFRVVIPNASPQWQTGLHIANGGVIRTTLLPGALYYIALPNHMERTRIEQPQAREIMRTVLQAYCGNELMAQARDAITEDVHVIIAPYDSLFVPDPWYRGRVVLVGDAAHATAPTIGSAGGMALEDAVVLADELSGNDVAAALEAYSHRRWERAKLVVETSVALMRGQQQHRPGHEWAEMRATAFRKLREPY